MVKFLSLRQLIIDPTSLKKMVYSVKKYLGLLKIMNVIVVNTRVSGTEELFVIDVVLKLLAKKFEEKEWDI